MSLCRQVLVSVCQATKTVRKSVTSGVNTVASSQLAFDATRNRCWCEGIFVVCLTCSVEVAFGGTHCTTWMTPLAAYMLQYHKTSRATVVDEASPARSNRGHVHRDASMWYCSIYSEQTTWYRSSRRSVLISARVIDSLFPEVIILVWTVTFL